VPTTDHDVPAPPRPRERPIVHSSVAVVAAATILAVVAIALVPRGPSFVDHVTIENSSAYPIRIEVAGGGGGGWTPIGTVGPGTTDVGEVVDQGDVWRIRFSVGEHPLGQIDSTRAALESATWHIVIPEEAIARAEAAGVRPDT
jgi:hypothetical protein